MRALQAMAVSRPPPRAMEATAATVGLGPLSSSEQKLSLILHTPKEVAMTTPLASISADESWLDAVMSYGCSSLHQRMLVSMLA